MIKPKVGTFASALRLIGSWQLKMFDDVLRQGVKATYSLIDKRRCMPAPTDVHSGASRESAAAAEFGAMDDLQQVSRRPPESGRD